MQSSKLLPCCLHIPEILSKVVIKVNVRGLRNWCNVDQRLYFYMDASVFTHLQELYGAAVPLLCKNLALFCISKGQSLKICTVLKPVNSSYLLESVLSVSLPSFMTVEVTFVQILNP